MEKPRAITKEQVATHNKVEDAWVVVSGKVYDITDCLKHHPPGIQIVLKHLGTDITQLFRAIHSQPTQQRILSHQLGHLSNSLFIAP